MLPKILYDLSVYAASASDLTAVQSFLKDVTRCYTSVSFNIFELLENSDRRLFDKHTRSDHPLRSLLPRYKDSLVRLRNRSSRRLNIIQNALKIAFLID